MPKKDKVSQKSEIFLSVLVIVVLLEIIHSAIISSGVPVVLNKSFFFGSFGDNSLAIFIGLILMAVILVYVKKRYVSPVALIFLFSGAITNVLDRLIHDGSIDYLHLLNIPLFNVPDIFIIIGAAIFFFEIAL